MVDPAEGGASPLRVAFVGNVANSLFQIVRALRGAPGLDAHLFIRSDEPLFGRPESIDPALTGGYPDWIHEGDWVSPRAVLAPRRAALTRELSAFDAVVASGPGPIWAQFAGVPWCFLVTGGDLTVKPFPMTFWAWYPSWSHRAAELVAGFWQRRAARSADQLWMQPFAPMVGAADRLRVPPSRVAPLYFPLAVETGDFDPDTGLDDPSPETRAVLDRMATSDLTVLHPSRMVLDDSPKMRRTGQWKGNDVLIRGFASFVATGVARDPLLVMPDLPGSRDLDRARALVVELGIEAHVMWAPPPVPQGFPRHELAELYRRSDVVADEFGIGWFGFIALEGLAVGKPVVTHVDEAVMARLYPEHPFCDARTPDDVARVLGELAADPERRARIGAAGRAWIERFHAPAAVRARYLDEFLRWSSELRRPATA